MSPDTTGMVSMTRPAWNRSGFPTPPWPAGLKTLPALASSGPTKNPCITKSSILYGKKIKGEVLNYHAKTQKRKGAKVKRPYSLRLRVFA